MTAAAERGLAVCVAGMHRSGTSMVARILAGCGVYLGRPEELLGPTADNPAGYFENVGFVSLNDAVLAKLGGAWDLPPTYVRSLLPRRDLGLLEKQASSLVDTMRPHAPWGWKDPRTSLTLPFWRRVVPELRVVVCVRDVVAVAHSLAQRGHSSEVFSMRLWTTYNRRLLRSAPRDRIVAVAYETLLDNPEKETARLIRRLALPADADLVARAAAGVDRNLCHHRVDYDPAGLPRSVARCRRDLLALLSAS